MRTIPRCVSVVSLAALGVGLVLIGHASGNGGKGKMLVLEDRVPMTGSKACVFRSEIDPTLFALLTLKDRYKVVRIQVRNDSSQSVVLSRQNDSVELVFGDRTTPGIIDLDQRDASLWDAFSVDMRRVLAYPGQVERGEEESVFVFVPAVGVDAPPQEIRLKVASLPQPVKLRRLVYAK